MREYRQYIRQEILDTFPNLYADRCTCYHSFMPWDVIDKDCPHHWMLYELRRLERLINYYDGIDGGTGNG